MPSASARGTATRDGARMLPQRPSAAIVIAFVALLAAISSPAWAAPATDAAKKAVRKVTTKDLASNAVTSSKVKDGSLLVKDFKKGQLPAGAAGATGATGATGAAGAKGVKGDPGVQGVPGPAVGGGAQSNAGNTLGAITTGITEAPVIQLTSTVNVTSSGKITVPFNARLLVQGFVDATNSAAAGARVRCNLAVSDPDGTGLTNFGSNVFMDMAPNSNDHKTFPVDGSTVVAPGTYNLAVECLMIGGTGGAYSAGLTVVAVPSA
ncbi:MAG: hypothetical protein JWR63_2336 [Conexibacter sp.]|nr:hypothetical protein [Conexibacter sp.]